MPGFTIHIAIAKRYTEKHINEIKNINDFIKGSIAPDLDENMELPCKDKSKSHFGKWGNNETEINLDKFLSDKSTHIEDDFWKGYFLHLLTDHYFYNEFFEKETKEIYKNNDKFYYDYDCLNKVLIDKYMINLSEFNFSSIKKYMYEINAEPKYLKINKVIDFIELLSSKNLNDEIEKYKHLK